MGLRFVDGSFLPDIESRQLVRFVESCRIDPMHTYFQGIFEDEMYKFIEFCKDILGNTWSRLQSFCSKESKWQWPVGTRSKGRAISEIFNATRKKSSTRAKNFKCGASEALTCFPLARRWAELHLQDKCMGSIQLLSFYACCDAMDALLRAKHRTTYYNTSHGAIKRHLICYS